MKRCPKCGCPDSRVVDKKVPVEICQCTNCSNVYKYNVKTGEIHV